MCVLIMKQSNCSSVLGFRPLHYHHRAMSMMSTIITYTAQNRPAKESISVRNHQNPQQETNETY
ncbi:hypothetical protein CUMW_177200 [Citrus unshiu]|uniref:Uncharacterized protein n=1 Tax=Citrus unshiu TaxID=55188 RepID=A0A2H5PXP8_CITUN|nr:hypothetical protein CUMW_177200 [Citrus unshiu]